MAARRARMEVVIAGAKPGDTQTELAARAGVTKQAISKVVTKDKRLSIVTEPLLD